MQSYITVHNFIHSRIAFIFHVLVTKSKNTPFKKAQCGRCLSQAFRSQFHEDLMRIQCRYKKSDIICERMCFFNRVKVHGNRLSWIFAQIVSPVHVHSLLNFTLRTIYQNVFYVPFFTVYYRLKNQDATRIPTKNRS